MKMLTVVSISLNILLIVILFIFKNNETDRYIKKYKHMLATIDSHTLNDAYELEFYRTLIHNKQLKYNTNNNINGDVFMPYPKGNSFGGYYFNLTNSIILNIGQYKSDPEIQIHKD